MQSMKILLLPSKCEIFFYPLKMVIFPILRQQYWTFLYCSPVSYRSSNFAIAKVVALCFNFCMSFIDWFIASLLYCFPYNYRSSNYCDSNSCRSYTLLKALAKSSGNLIAIAFKSEKERNYRYRDSWKSENFRKEANKKEAKN